MTRVNLHCPVRKSLFLWYHNWNQGKFKGDNVSDTSSPEDQVSDVTVHVYKYNIESLNHTGPESRKQKGGGALQSRLY